MEFQMMHEKRKETSSFLQSLIRFFERGVFAPFLLAIQPVWHLFLINETELYFSEAVRSLLVSLLFAAIVLSLTYLLVRSWFRASVIASLFILLFFLFGDLSDWIVTTFGFGPVRADILLLVFVMICMILWFWLVQKKVHRIAPLNLYFNLPFYAQISIN